MPPSRRSNVVNSNLSENNIIYPNHSSNTLKNALYPNNGNPTSTSVARSALGEVSTNIQANNSNNSSSNNNSLLDRKRKPDNSINNIIGRKLKRPSNVNNNLNNLNNVNNVNRPKLINQNIQPIQNENNQLNKMNIDYSPKLNNHQINQNEKMDTDINHNVMNEIDSNSNANSTSNDWDDLDVDDILDPMMVAEYVEDIFPYLKELEIQTMPNPNYMDDQKELLWHMRTILVDWLIEVHNKFKLLPETLYLSINIIDRFLSLRVVSVPKLQLVGITAMFIASKYEEVIAPSIQNFIYMADGGYTEEEILKAERYMLQVLDFSLQYPSPMSFLRRCSKADNYDIQTRTLAKYFMEISLLDNKFLDITSSMIAAASMYLARVVLDRGNWDKNLIHYSGYKESELLHPVSLLLNYIRTPRTQEALYKKYASRKYMRIAVYVSNWVAKGNIVPSIDNAI